MHARFLWAAVLGFLCGVLARSLLPIGMSIELFAALLGIGALCAHFLERMSASKVLFAVFCIAFALGCARMGASVLVGDPYLDARIGDRITLEAIVKGEPDIREAGARVPLDAEFASTTPVQAGVLALLPPHTEIAYGDRVRVSGVLRLPEAFDTTLGRTFNYPAYLAKDGIGYQLAYAHVDSVLEHGGSPLVASAIAVKQWFLRGLDTAIAEPEAGLAAGTMVGDKRGLGEDLSDVFQTVGLVHIIVLSGYNITIVIALVRLLFASAPRAAEYAGAIGVVFFFAAMSGFASSAVRAGAMALIAIYAGHSGRIFNAPRVLAIVACAMVAWDPFLLVFDPGFQLSALATLGLVLFSGPVAEKLYWIPARFGLREAASSTLGTQLAVLPLLLWQNGQFSIFALPANLLVLAVVPATMLLSLIAALGGALVPPIAVVIGAPAYFLLAYIINIARLFAAIPFASLSIPAFPWWVMALSYVLLFSAYALYSGRIGKNEKSPAPQGGAGRKSSRESNYIDAEEEAFGAT